MFHEHVLYFVDYIYNKSYGKECIDMLNFVWVSQNGVL